MHDTQQLTHDAPAAEAAPTARERRSWVRFALHFVEMVVAMGLGMVVFGGALHALLAVAGVEYTMARFPELVLLDMGVTMTLGMAGWMYVRRHRTRAVVEMSAAMLVPVAVVILLVALGLMSAGTAMLVEHVAMLPLMLVAMLFRIDEYTGHHSRHGTHVRHATGRRRVLATVARVLVVLLAAFLVPAGVYAIGSTSYEQSRYAQAEPSAAAAAALAEAPKAHDPTKPTAVVVVGNAGANVADTLVPYDVLASTGAFNVYTVAPERRPLPLLGGLDLVPDLSFDQLRERLGGAAPDVTVVPELPESSSDAAVVGWLRDTASDGLLLGVCTGARLLAEAGLLDGQPATSHWYRIGGLAQRYPAVQWQQGARYLDEGNVITTGGLLSSVDGSLRVIERLVGGDAATAAAGTVGWRHYLPGAAAPLPIAKVSMENGLVHLLNIGFRANSTTLGVVLTDGVGELELAAAFAPYGEVKAARTLAITADGQSIRSRHGLTFVPRADGSAAQRVDRVLVPGLDAAASPDPTVAASAGSAGVPVAYLHQRPGFAFDASLQDMAASMDVPTASWAAKILEYSAAQVGLSGPTWPWGAVERAFLLALTGAIIAALGLTWLARSRASRR
ncbi:DJ-1/PfpI family protein [Pseudonocardia sp. TRM90224]|uniref:DJ-1/PfpI family protein n=1 Tax=Pseudonocardia sp. TRM90224 TaxID=2812678 RepID=UPI001E3EF58E|nr:DJ-1/PfpI family protein [Pseudonocardia sp. TRM90224]